MCPNNNTDVSGASGCVTDADNILMKLQNRSKYVPKCLEQKDEAYSPKRG